MALISDYSVLCVPTISIFRYDIGIAWLIFHVIDIDIELNIINIR